MKKALLVISGIAIGLGAAFCAFLMAVKSVAKK